MRFRLAAVLFLGAALPAAAQDQSVIAVPLPPPVVSAPSVITPAPTAPAVPAPPPGLVQTPVPPSVDTTTGTATTPGTGTATTAAPAVPPDTAPVPDNTWQPGTSATLGVLDKVDGGSTQVSIPVGGHANIGDLQVSVQACVTRPPGALPDAAIFLSAQATGDNAGTVLYRGWMVRSTPGATAVGDAGETFRVIGCS